ncbi:MAG: hormogonium polysaccharide biosynthesis glycosyltransferase HpsE [Cyanobacteria bacterium J06592_8]
MDLSIAICTYNGETRISEVLEALLQQQNTEGIAWEVLVVDNNSTDRTAKVVSELSKNWHSDSQLRYIREEQQGLAYARIRSMQAATSELVAFLDDDNIPASNWVREAYSFAIEHPQAGAYGGNIHFKLDSPPPSYFDKVKIYLTIYNRGSQAFRYSRSEKSRRVPAGAGCVFRKSAWNDVVPSSDKLLISGRDPKTLAAGEDAEILYYLQNTNWEIWHNPKLEVWHHIYPERLEKAYLLKLARGYGLSQYPVRLARYYAWQRPFVTLLTPILTLREGVRVLDFYLKNRQDIKENFGKACEFEAKLGCLYSPWFKLIPALVKK